MPTVGIVQQSAWDIPIDSMPLAAGYLKAMLEDDKSLRGDLDVTIYNFRGGVTLTRMAKAMFSSPLPDIMAFSVLGWNYRNFVCLADTYKQLRPDGMVVFGGNHVSHQAARIFQNTDSIDVLVNGEGELTFRDLVMAVACNPKQPRLGDVPGLSFRTDAANYLTTSERGRIQNLDVIPSPFLTGAIPLNEPGGDFSYEFALLETNRGCPYKCAFCYWGGAVGQRVRSFSRERLAAELDFLAAREAGTIFLCDANFGMLEADEEFVEDIIHVREKYGYPKALEANWAKNKSSRFQGIVRTLKKHGLKSSFTLALQTLTDDALQQMNRSNMKINQWTGLVDWLTDEGLDCYAEMIWGAPGDTPSQFLHGYDQLAQRVPRIAVYPLLVLPNTSYSEQRELHGFVTIRGQYDDFEYALASRTASVAESLQMQRFMYLARILGENQYFKHLWSSARLLAGMSQSTVINSLLGWLSSSEHPSARRFLESFPVIAESPAVARGHRFLYTDPDIDDEIQRWWRDQVVARFPGDWCEFGEQLYRYARWCRPVYHEPSRADTPIDYLIEGDEYISSPIAFSFPMASILERLTDSTRDAPARDQTVYRFHALCGFYEHLDNHEVGAHYFARPVVIAQ
jgi:radical SAM C-methyltransferase